MKRTGTLQCAARVVLIAAVLGAFPATGANAAGFALREQSATAQGNAFAGATASAEDVSYMFFNPATLGFLNGYRAMAVLSYIQPDSELESASATTVGATPIGGSTAIDDVTGDVVTPALYGMAELPGGLRAGLGINVPFGLETGYPDDWVGRYHTVDAELLTVNVNPVLAWRPLDWLAVGAGLQAQYVRAELSNAVDFGTIGAAGGVPGAVPTTQDGRAMLEGDDWGYGFNLGVLVEPLEGTRVGLAYRSEIEHELEGDAEFDLDTAGVGAALQAATGAFADTGGSADLTTPAMLSLGVHQDLTSRWSIMGEAAWTGWSTFEELRVRFDNPAQADNVTEEEWEDSFFVALGTTYRATDTLALRGGIAFDQTPVEDEHRNPQIPDEDRYWLSVGLSWEPVSWLGVDAAYTHIWVDDGEVDLSATEPGNTFRGNLQATYDTSIDIFAVSGRLRF